MRLIPIVEGEGEVEAVPVLVRRVLARLNATGVQVTGAIRGKRGKFRQEKEVQRYVQIARGDSQCAGVLILFDGDDDCPAEWAPRIQQWAAVVSGGIPCSVVIANREYEAWFLASIEALRDKRGIRSDACSELQPEDIRGAKERLKTKMEPDAFYSPKADQPALSQCLDMDEVYDKCRSFRKLVKAVSDIVRHHGDSPSQW